TGSPTTIANTQAAMRPIVPRPMASPPYRPLIGRPPRRPAASIAASPEQPRAAGCRSAGPLQFPALPLADHLWLAQQLPVVIEERRPTFPPHARSKHAAHDPQPAPDECHRRGTNRCRRRVGVDHAAPRGTKGGPKLLPPIG